MYSDKIIFLIILNHFLFLLVKVLFLLQLLLLNENEQKLFLNINYLCVQKIFY